MFCKKQSYKLYQSPVITYMEKIIGEDELQKHIDAARLLGMHFSLTDCNMGTEENKVFGFKMYIY